MPVDDALSANDSLPAPQKPPAASVQVTVQADPGVEVWVTVEARRAGAAPGEAAPRVTKAVHPGQTPQTIHLPAGETAAVAAEAALAAPRPDPAQPRRRWPYSLAATLFAFGLLVYALTRVIGIEDFPIYFFTDEAVQTVLAADLVRDNFQNYEKEFLPTYFPNGSYYNLSTSVYVQVLPYLLFGKSVLATRLTAALLTLLAAAWVGLILRDHFKLSIWWAGPLLLAVVPAWFLHSRTAFETSLMATLYSGMLYFYLRYRLSEPRALYPAVTLGALAFYSYSPGQVIVAVTGILLLLSDVRYHWQQRGVVLRAAGLLILLALPYLRYRLAHPERMAQQLANLLSYWSLPIPLSEKLARYAAEYVYGLSPGYWFIPNQTDLSRHLLLGYGHLPRVLLPLMAWGLLLALYNWRSPAHRLVLAALLAAPSGAALVQIGITRVLVYVIPAVILIALGLDSALGLLRKRLLARLPERVWLGGMSAALALAFSAAGFWMLGDALVNGPAWFSDYGLGGMQYGARQLFGEIKTILRQQPETRLVVTPTWTNGADVVARFFLPDPLPFTMGSIEGYLFERLPLDDNMLFVLTPEEYQQAGQTSKFKSVAVVKTIPYPDGRPGFYFTRLAYADNLDALLAEERQQRRALLQASLEINGQPAQAQYSRLDMGEIVHAFDGSPDTLIRTLEANPLVIEIQFAAPVSAGSLYLRFGATELEVQVELDPGENGPAATYRQTLAGTVEKPDGTLQFAKTETFRRLRLTLRDLRQPEPGHVHLWEIELR